jgi:hypothetical protein
MTGLRRHASILGIALAWMIAFATLLGGLALGRSLPEAHARAIAQAALAHDGLCRPGGEGAPAGHDAGHGGSCILCPAPAGAPQLAPPPAPASIAALDPDVAATLAATSDRADEDGFRLAARARAPPRA